MGGVDRLNATGRVLDALEKCDLPRNVVIHVVMGPTAPWLDEVRAHAAHSRCETHVHVDIRNMAQLHGRRRFSDRAGRPPPGSAVVSVYRRLCWRWQRIEKPVAQAVAARGAAIFVGDADNGPEAAADLTAQLCRDPAQLSTLGRAAAECVLGDGAARVAGVLVGEAIRTEADSELNEICLRSVNLEDAVALWRWRNDPETRHNSISTAELSLQEHMTWFEASLRNPARVIYVSEFRGVKCGSVRFDFIDIDKNLWRVSIMMNPEFRGRGSGSASLSLACVEMERRYGDCSFTAEARPFNAPSLRIFERCGFSRTSEVDGLITLSRGASCFDASS